MHAINISDGFILLVALLHFYFLILEMFLWTKPFGLKNFKMTPQKAQDTSVLAANQGLYNGFLGAGLIWSLLLGSFEESYRLKVFFLSCVAVAGIFGAVTANRKIFFVQALPAMIALILLCCSK